MSQDTNRASAEKKLTQLWLLVPANRAGPVRPESSSLFLLTSPGHNSNNQSWVIFFSADAPLSKGRLLDSSEHHARCKGSIRASFQSKLSKIRPEMAKLTTNLPMGDCVTQASIMRNVRDPLGLHLNQKYLKSGQKRLSYGQFTNGRLRDSSE